MTVVRKPTSTERRRLSPEILATMPHGIYTTYGRGCRCEPCTAALRRKKAETRARRKEAA